MRADSSTVRVRTTEPEVKAVPATTGAGLVHGAPGRLRAQQLEAGLGFEDP